MDERLGVVSLFSGVGGLEIGLENAGMRSVYQCEIDAHCRHILEHHWPGLPRWDDVSTLTGREILSKVDRADVIAWGSPCQDLSVAGRRAGLGGERSGLFYEGMRIIRELREESSGQFPRISIWENVAGALSSNKGADFGVILDEMAEAGALVIEWRLLDAQYFGVPQRRRRVFVVAVFDPAVAAGCPDPLLSLSEGLLRYPAPSRAQREGSAGASVSGSDGSRSVANTIGASLYHKGTVVNQDVNSDHLVVDNPNSVISFPTNFGSYAQATEDIAQSMAVKAGPPSVVIPENTARPIGTSLLGSEIVGSLNSVDYKWPQNQQLVENKFVPVDEPAVGQIGVIIRQGGKLSDGLVPSLRAEHHRGDNEPVVIVNEPILFENSYRDAARVATDGVSSTLSAKMGTGGNNTPMVAQSPPDGVIGIQGNVIGRLPENGPAGKGHTEEGEPMFTLTSTDVHAVSVDQPAIPREARVRRLTPLECERLMGWPDDWTRWRADGKEQKDSHRYKQCGNGVASPVTEWIGGIIVRLLGGAS